MKYAPLRFELKRQFPGYKVTQCNIIVDVLGGASMNTAKSIKALIGERPERKTLINNYNNNNTEDFEKNQD